MLLSCGRRHSRGLPCRWGAGRKVALPAVTGHGRISQRNLLSFNPSPKPACPSCPMSLRATTTHQWPGADSWESSLRPPRVQSVTEFWAFYRQTFISSLLPLSPSRSQLAATWMAGSILSPFRFLLVQPLCRPDPESSCPMTWSSVFRCRRKSAKGLVERTG